MASEASFDELMASLAVGASKLRLEEIIALQRTLNEACRIHDPKQAEEMADLLERAHAKQPTVGTPPDVVEGERKSAEKPPRRTFASQKNGLERGTAPMSVDFKVDMFEPPLGKFQLGVTGPNQQRARHKSKVIRRLEPALRVAAKPPPDLPRVQANKPPQLPLDAELSEPETASSTQAGNPECNMSRQPEVVPRFEIGKPPPPPRKQHKMPVASASLLKKMTKLDFSAGETDALPQSPSFKENRAPTSKTCPTTKEEEQPRSWEVHYERAKKLYEAGDYKGAAVAYGTAADCAPPTWPLTAKAYGNRGACWIMLGQSEEAKLDCREATRRDPTLYKAHNRVGRLELEAGETTEALASFEAARRWALEKHAGDRDAAAAVETAESGLAETRRLVDNLIRAEAALGRADKQRPPRRPVDEEDDSSSSVRDRARDESLRAACRAECERARRYADAALATSPGSRRAAIVKARALAGLDKWTELNKACTAFAGSADPSSASVARRLASQDAALTELYILALRRLEPAETCAARSRVEEALAAVVESDFADSAYRERCRGMLQRSAKLRRAKDRADSAYTRGHFRAAVAMYRDALRLDTDRENDALRAALHGNLAAAAFVLGRLADTDEHCTMALRLRPDYLRARLRRARARAKLERQHAALVDYDTYLDAATSATYVPRSHEDSIERVTVERRKLQAELRRRRSADEANRRQSHQQQKPVTNEASANSLANATTHYAVLGLKPDARAADLKRAYAALALRFHPDRNDDPGATAAMARINAAYECLKDPALRAK